VALGMLENGLLPRRLEGEGGPLCFLLFAATQCMYQLLSPKK